MDERSAFGPAGGAGHAQYGATAQSYRPQENYSSRWQSSPASQGLASQAGYQGSSSVQAGSSSFQAGGYESGFGQAGQEHAQYGATAQSYRPEENYTSRWQQPSASAAGSGGLSNQFGQYGFGQYGQAGQVGQYGQGQQMGTYGQYGQYGQYQQQAGAGQFGQAGPYGQYAQAGSLGQAPQAAQYGSYGQATAQAGGYGPAGQGLASQAGYQGSSSFQAGRYESGFGQAEPSHAQYGATAQSYRPEEHYSSRWQQPSASAAGQGLSNWSQAGQLQGASHAQYGATAQTYNSQENYSARWQSQAADEQAGGAFRG